MHELSLAGAIQETAIRHAEGRPVRSVQMRIGRLRQVVPDSLSFYFGIVTAETICDGAILDLELIDARLRCGVCRREWDPAPQPAEEEGELLLVPTFRCPHCEAAGAEVLSGEEFEVESIVVEDDPHAGLAEARSSGTI